MKSEPGKFISFPAQRRVAARRVWTPAFSFRNRTEFPLIQTFESIKFYDHLPFPSHPPQLLSWKIRYTTGNDHPSQISVLFKIICRFKELPTRMPIPAANAGILIRELLLSPSLSQLWTRVLSSLIFRVQVDPEKLRRLTKPYVFPVTTSTPPLPPTSSIWWGSLEFLPSLHPFPCQSHYWSAQELFRMKVTRLVQCVTLGAQEVLTVLEKREIQKASRKNWWPGDQVDHILRPETVILNFCFPSTSTLEGFNREDREWESSLPEP